MSKIRRSTYKRLAVKRKMLYQFSFWCADKYGISPRGIYEKLRRGRTKIWEWEGILNCIKQHEPEWEGTAKEFWDSHPHSSFATFMGTKQMSWVTVWKKFEEDNWSDMEVRGIKNVYREYRSTLI